MKKGFSTQTFTFVCIVMMVLLSFQALSEDNYTTESSFLLNGETEQIAQILLSESSTLGVLLDQGFSLLEVNKEQTVAVAYVSEAEKEWLMTQGISYTIIYDSFAQMNGWDTQPALLKDFTDYESLTTQLQEIVDNYPDIAQLYDLGQSVQGRTLWGLKITDNPLVEEDEPEVRICGCHHGNELMSVELPLLLAWYLVENYETDPSIQNLVEERETWIIPMVNPDGRQANTRYNANGVDLNRDYGYMQGVYGDFYTQPETRIIREHALDNNFVLSLSFHTSGDIVNYVWNYKGQPVADNDVVVMLSEQYGSHNGYWVVEGFDWYQTKGDTNDFSYGCRGDIDWTIEVQNNDIPEAWDLNRDAMIEIIEAADIGLRGIITDAISGEPVSATVWVEEAYWPCFTDPKVGDYHRVLLPGTYTVHYTANGYEEEIRTVVVDESEPTIQDVSLQRESTYYAQQVTSCYFADAYSYPNSYQNNPTEAISALGAPDDSCASLGKGGVLIVDMEYEISDSIGEPDLKIFEGDGSDDGYHVRVSKNFNGPWIELGSGFGTTEFDLADGPIDSIRFVEIQDDFDGNAYEQNPGVDIDAVENLAGVNLAPNTPQQPQGPSSGSTMVDYIFSTSTQDPEDDEVFYMWDWGDGNCSSWLGPFPSGSSAQANHAWSQSGPYQIRVKAKDINELESAYSQPFILNIADGPILEISGIAGGLFTIDMTIRNIGVVDAVGVDWAIDLDGGLCILGQQSSGRITGIAAGDEVTVTSDLIFGFGKTVVNATVTLSDVTMDAKEADAVVVFVFIMM